MIAVVFQLAKEYPIELSLKRLISGSYFTKNLIRSIVIERRFSQTPKEIYLVKLMSQFKKYFKRFI